MMILEWFRKADNQTQFPGNLEDHPELWRDKLLSSNNAIQIYSVGPEYYKEQYGSAITIKINRLDIDPISWDRVIFWFRGPIVSSEQPLVFGQEVGPDITEAAIPILIVPTVQKINDDQYEGRTITTEDIESVGDLFRILGEGRDPYLTISDIQNILSKLQ